jgi:hypothetical protein
VDPLIKPVRKLLAADIKKIAKPIFPVSLSAHNRIQARKSRVRLIGFRVNEKTKIAKPLQPVSLFARQDPLPGYQESDQFRFWVNASAK